MFLVRWYDILLISANFPGSVSGNVCLLRQLGWLRLFRSPGVQQPGLGNTAGHTTYSGKDRIYIKE